MTTVSAQIDAETVRKAEAVLGRQGFTMTELIEWVITWVAEDKALPLEIGTPNAETIEAMRARDRSDTKYFDSLDAFHKDLNAND